MAKPACSEIVRENGETSRSVAERVCCLLVLNSVTSTPYMSTTTVTKIQLLSSYYRGSGVALLRGRASSVSSTAR